MRRRNPFAPGGNLGQRAMTKLLKYARQGSLPEAYVSWRGSVPRGWMYSPALFAFLSDFWPDLSWPHWQMVNDVNYILGHNQFPKVHAFFMKKYGFDFKEELEQGLKEQYDEDFPGEEWKHNPIRGRSMKRKANADAVHIDIIQGRGAHHNPASRAAQGFISSKIRKLAHEGYTDPLQREAISYSMARRRGFKIPRKNPVGKFAVVDHGAVIPSLGLRYTVQRLSGGPLHPLLPGQRIVAEGMTERMARQLAGSLNRPLRGNPRGVLFRKRRNPVLAVMGANPPHAAGDEINATWARIEYRRPDDPEGKRTVRVHDFEDGFVATPLADGSVLLKHPRGKHLWTRR